MQAKFIALAACLLAAVAADWWSVSAAPKGVGDHIDLIPPALAGLATTKRWRHPLDERGVVEDGAVYSAPDGAQIMVDYWRGIRGEHNGIFCFVVQGESVVREQSMQVQTRAGRSDFTVALLRNGGSLRLAASTHCRPDGCEGSPLRLGSAPFTGSPWASLLSLRLGLLPMHEPIVPLTVLVEHPGRIATDGVEMERQLLEEFRRVAGDLDLRPAQELARQYRS